MKRVAAGNLWMLVAGFFFACMGVLVKVGAETLSSNELVFYRSLFGLMTIFVLTRSSGRSLATQRWKLHLWRSLAGFVSLILYFYAIAELPLATAVTLNYTSPLFLAALALFYMPRATKPVLLWAIVTGFVGVALLLQPSFTAGTWLPALLGLISGLLAGVAYLQVTQLGRLGEPEWRTVFYFTLLSTLGSGLWMLVHQFHALSLRDLLLLAAMGACATLAQLAMTRAYRKGEPLVAGSLAYSTVILSSAFGFVLWGETITPTGWAGVAMIVFSGILSLRGRTGFDKSTQAPTL